MDKAVRRSTASFLDLKRSAVRKYIRQRFLDARRGEAKRTRLVQ